jgi:hypothetical protein
VDGVEVVVEEAGECVAAVGGSVFVVGAGGGVGVDDTRTRATALISPTTTRGACRHWARYPMSGVQRLDDSEEQVGVESASAGFEVDDGGLLGQFAGWAAGGGPEGVDPVLDLFVGGVAGPDLEGSQHLDEVVEGAGPAWVDGWWPAWSRRGSVPFMINACLRR